MHFRLDGGDRQGRLTSGDGVFSSGEFLLGVGSGVAGSAHHSSDLQAVHDHLHLAPALK